jgi:cyclohexa-1,5-dienecarbonyl-CoA hydratase
MDGRRGGEVRPLRRSPSRGNRPGHGPQPPAGRIECGYDGEIAYVTLDNPPVNVIDFPMIAAIKAFLSTLKGEQRLCAIVFQARGRTFSAGVDVGSHLPATVHEMIREFHSVFELLDELEAPTVSLVRGPCLGGACELAGYQDVVIATENARFGLPEIKLGVFPPVAAAVFPRRFRFQAAMQLLLTGDTIEPAAAVRAGLVSRLVPESDAEVVLERLLRSFRDKSASSLRIVKRATLRARGWSFREAVAPSEQVYLEELMATRDAVEGLQAFLEKRDPSWSHE